FFFPRGGAAPPPGGPPPPPASTAGKRQLKRAPARVQWDPERDLHLQPLPHRSLQLGLAGEAAERYAEQWIVSIDDVTALAHTIQAQVRDGALEAARQLLPAERPYPVTPPRRKRRGFSLTLAGVATDQPGP
ncbi:DUF4291 family protein, partial [Kitasatospora sp. NPDC059812]|uniref:DUF4291 family protein n=1 Tax=Kitasatospora sp. NPDC059812 TaxID=3346958 RepID=UPI0036506B26